jgi:D-arabinose 1-dehydrogenase-like Zn-dependent alcohol dehydrogenase
MKVRLHTLVPLPGRALVRDRSRHLLRHRHRYGALKRLNLQGGETIAIFGQGPVGVVCDAACVAMGARVIALDVSPQRNDLARDSARAMWSTRARTILSRRSAS